MTVIMDELARGRHPGLDPGWISMGIEAASQAPALNAGSC